MKNLLTAAVALVLALLLPSPSKAFCLDAAADSRLQVYCLSKVLSGTATNLQSAQMLDFRIKQEGYDNGIGLPGNVRPMSLIPYIAPILEYSSDINGGNPNRPLVLGSLTFYGDEEFYRKKGIIAGIGIGSSGRIIFGQGKYLNLNFGVSYAHSPEHDIGVSRFHANICSKNDIGNNFYLDGCFAVSGIHRELTSETTGSATVSIAKLFSKGTNRFNQASFGVSRFFDKGYDQNQILVRFDTLYRSGFFTSFNASVGPTVAANLAMRHSLSATVGTTFLNKPIRATASYTYSDGGKLLGFSREDALRFFSITYAVHPRVSLSMGYREISSSIDYFSESEAIFGVQFSPIKF
ncbi:hypothetical protein ACFQ3C_05010 [Seohaeicola saemankumensis]|uniref:Uncharacterized protein n=1 Tax=Seohaeicola saemankumensis TaxID=481181 RepID=A0ABW3TDA8_9RHOB